MATTDEEIVQRAENRARVTGFLNTNEGEHAVSQVAEALGLSRGTAGQMLAKMAKDKLVKVRKEGTSKLYSMRGHANHITMGEEEGEVAAKRTYTKRGAVKTKDVELVVAGTMIVIGRNEKTGRLRITLDDIS